MKFNSTYCYAFALGMGMFFLQTFSQASVPVSHIKGIDELFDSEFKIYSPLTGLLHHHTTIKTLFREFFENGGEHYTHNENLKKLYEALFVKTPSEEIVPSHLPNNPAANLTGTIIAKLLIELERLKKQGFSEAGIKPLERRILDVIISDEGYQENLQQAKDNLKEIKREEEKFDLLLQEQEEQSKRAEKFKKEHLSPVYIQIKKLKAQLKKEKRDSNPELIALSQKKLELESQYESMKIDFINTDQKADTHRKLTHQIKNHDIENESYHTNLQALADLLAQSFIQYDLASAEIAQGHYRATTIALLSYLWMKYDNKLGLRGYLETAAKAGLLKHAEWTEINNNFYKDYYLEDNYINIKKKFLSSKNKNKWVNHTLVDSIALASDNAISDGKDTRAPKPIPFSYSNWMSYNPLFADCTENAVHNIFNLIAFNPTTGHFDVEILKQLKEKYYPNLDQRLLDYYARYYTFDQHDKRKAKKKWIDLLIGLNHRGKDLPKEQRIRYLRHKSEVLANYANIMRVVNRLLGYSDVIPDNMAEIFSRVKEISGFAVSYTHNAVHNGSEQAEFKVGKTTFLLTSYGHLHCLFKRQKNHDNELAQKITQILYEKSTHYKKNPDKIFRYSSAAEYLFDCQKNL